MNDAPELPIPIAIPIPNPNPNPNPSVYFMNVNCLWLVYEIDKKQTVPVETDTWPGTRYAIRGKILGLVRDPKPVRRATYPDRVQDVFTSFRIRT